MIKHRSLLMLFSDLLADPEPVIESLQLLRHAGHDVIVFHILDEAEVNFPFDGMVDFRDPETGETMLVDAAGIRGDYLDSVGALRARHAAGHLIRIGKGTLRTPFRYTGFDVASSPNSWLRRVRTWATPIQHS